MGFKNWLAFHASTAGLVIVAMFVGLFGAAALIADMTILGIGTLIASGVIFMYARYRYREYDIHTQQRKYGMR